MSYAGASPNLRDFGRGLSAVEWARYTGRHLCCDVIESVERSCSSQIKERWTSDPDMKVTGSGTSARSSKSPPPIDHRDSWLKNKVQKIIRE